MARPASEPDDWLRGLSHGLRNSVGTICSVVQLAEHLVPPGGEAADCLRTVAAEAGRIDLLVRRAQLFAGLRAEPAEQVRVEDLVAEVVHEAQAAARQAGVGLRAEPGGDLTARIALAQGRLALQELVRNAVSFSSKGGTAVVRWEGLGDAELGVHVDDACPGIPSSAGPRILRPFFSTSGGTGIGLNIASRACELAGGRVEWRNRDQGGCRFTMCLPRG